MGALPPGALAGGLVEAIAAAGEPAVSTPLIIFCMQIAEPPMKDNESEGVLNDRLALDGQAIDTDDVLVAELGSMGRYAAPLIYVGSSLRDLDPQKRFLGPK